MCVLSQFQYPMCSLRYFQLNRSLQSVFIYILRGTPDLSETGLFTGMLEIIIAVWELNRDFPAAVSPS